MVKALLVIATLMASGYAQAETFICTGSSQFADVVDFQTVDLKWPDKAQTSFGDVQSVKVFFDLDKANTKAPYLQITVMKMNEKGIINSQSAKGSVRDMVMFSQIDGTETSQIVCIPSKR